MKQVITTLILLFTALTIMAQSNYDNYAPAFRDAMVQGEKLYNQGRYQEARTCFVKAKNVVNGGNPTEAQKKISACDAKIRAQKEEEAEMKRKAELEAEEERRAEKVQQQKEASKAAEAKRTEEARRQTAEIEAKRKSDREEAAKRAQEEKQRVEAEALRRKKECENGVRDYDGNIYKTVLLGKQCWMAENLRTTHYPDGTIVVFGKNSNKDYAPYCYYPDKNISNVTTYGYYYNWLALMHGARASKSNPSGVQGICPAGWHVPSDAEWKQLIDYVSRQSENVCGNDGANVAKALASKVGWEYSDKNCAVGNDGNANNKTGFSAIPSGGSASRYYFGFGTEARFWSATAFDESASNAWKLSYDAATVSVGWASNTCGRSVRCVRN